MTPLFAIYVGAKAATNLTQGIRRSTWGWKHSAMDKGDARAVAAAMRASDVLALGAGGPDPRVGPGQWSDAKLRKLILVRVVSPLYLDTTPLWPDEAYPNRVGFELLEELDLRYRRHVGAGLMEALRMSANKNGVAVRAGHVEDCAELLSAMSRPADIRATRIPGPAGRTEARRD